MKTIWKLYYRLTLGKSYEKAFNTSKNYNKMIQQSTHGKLNHFYNSRGEKIRGWEKPQIRFKDSCDKHPLQIKYS
jgi:hypothetical protein